MQALNNRKFIRGCYASQRNKFMISAQTEPKRKRQETMCTNHAMRVTFRLVRLLPVWCVTRITRRVYCRPLGTYVLKFLHVFFSPLSTFESRDLVSLSSDPSFLLFLEGQLWEVKVGEKLCHFLSVTLNNTLNILAYTYCFTKPQNKSFLFKTRAPDNEIKFEK